MKTEQEKPSETCHGFFWSESKQRLGAIFRDHTLCFWEAHDDLKLEKKIYIGNNNIEEQNKIWYVDHKDTWITTA